MDLAPYFKSIVEQDRCAVVICDIQHQIVYMNPAAKQQYSRWGGGDLVGRSLLDCHNRESGERIREVVAGFAADAGHSVVYTHHNEKQNKDVYMVALRDDCGNLIGYYEKHEYRNPETASPYNFVY